MKEIFKIGDKVMIITEALNGKEGTITKILDKNMNENSNGTKFVVENDDTVNGYVMERNEIILVSREGDEASHYNESIKKVSPRQPSFKTGDIVIIKDFPGKIQYVVKECTFTEQATRGRTCPLYSYELNILDESMADGGMIPSKCMCDEYSLILEYHDAQWEKYFTESVHNNLPAWRGEIYNLLIFYTGQGSLEEYNNDTIPPIYMQHILNMHSISERINQVVKNSTNPRMDQNVKTIMNAMNMKSTMEVTKLGESIRKKIHDRNLADIDPSYRSTVSNKMTLAFSDLEREFVSWIDKLDIVDGIIEDHYPAEMTNSQIMKAIKEAYHNSEKYEQRKVSQVNKDKRTGETYAADKGYALYVGKSETYGLTIMIQFNFDLNLIETAHPIGMNDDVVKRISTRKINI